MPCSCRLRGRTGYAVFLIAIIANYAPGAVRAQKSLQLGDVVRATLEANPDIRRSVESTRQREAELLMVEGAFDTVVRFDLEQANDVRLFSGTERALYDVASARSRITQYRIAAPRLFRSGATIAPVVELTRQDALTLDAPPIIQTRAALELTYPILNVGGRSAEYAELESAVRRLEAGRFEARHVRAQSVYRAVVAYWSYLGAAQALRILSASEEKSRRLLDDTRALVEGGERAAGDLDQLRADLADRYAARLAAEQRLFESRRLLATEMGLWDEEGADLPVLASDFPRLHPEYALLASSAMEGIAMSQRADLDSAERSVAAADAARQARSILSRPRLDIRLAVGYAGLSERRLAIHQHLPPFGQNHVNGAHASLGLSLRWPPSNRYARGSLEAQEAVWRGEAITEEEVRRQIRVGVRAAAERLRTSIGELAKRHEAAELYAAAVANEERKLQLGMSTQFDLILVEERHRNSMLAQVEAQVRYAEAIARIRIETGTLINEMDNEDAIVERLIRPPHDLY